MNELIYYQSAGITPEQPIVTPHHPPHREATGNPVEERWLLSFLLPRSLDDLYCPNVTGKLLARMPGNVVVRGTFPAMWSRGGESGNGADSNQENTLFVTLDYSACLLTHFHE